MTQFQRIVCLVLVVCGFALPVTLSAQAPDTAKPATPAAPGIAQTDQQKKGEALFLKNCALCHIHTNQKAQLKIQASTELVGLFQKPTTTEAGVRRMLMQGLPGFMPSFQYALEPKDHDDLVAYLKVR
jgi:mono/diheme cytochrome c family protein